MAVIIPMTPETVSLHGWRDDAYKGEDACVTCGGWGTRIAGVDDAHSTCSNCGGTGHEPVIKT